ncbi:MAG: protein kinase [Myxococcales bacterium]|nr:protein kinase [Myxococcales bacterium]
MSDDDEARDLYVGRLVDGRYRVTRAIGTGGMGAVYEAEQEAMGRRVALKILHTSLASDASIVRRFKNEARASGTLGHPNIARAFDFGRTEDGAPFIAMELLSGRDLAAVLAAEGPLPVARSVAIVDQIAAALGAAHEAGIVHRDVKPENVFLVEGDVVKVLDFGISKFAHGSGSVATRAGTFLGSPAFMSPEQVQDASKADARTDVYALGAVLYNMLTGQLMFTGTSLPMLIVAIINDPPTPLESLRPDVPADLAELVRRMTAKEPSGRPASMAEVRAGLASLGSLDASPPPASVPSSTPTAELVESRIELPVSGRPRLAIAGVAIALLAAAGAGAFAMSQPDAVDTPPAAEPPAPIEPPVLAEPVEPVSAELPEGLVPPDPVEPAATPPVPVDVPTTPPADPEPTHRDEPTGASRRGRRSPPTIPTPQPLPPDPSTPTVIDGVPIDDTY